MSGGQMSAWEEAVEQEQPAPGAAGSGRGGAGRAGSSSGAASGAPGAGAKSKEKDKPEPTFKSFLEFVNFLFTRKLIARRPGGAVAWCPQWYKHAEVIARLMTVWDEFEKAKVAKTTSDWFLHCLDPHLAVIFNKNNGPFMACTEKEHREIPALPLGKPDAKLFSGSVFSQPKPDRPKRTVAAARQAAAERRAAPAQGQSAAAP
jgi:hypothetical protein